jgi:tRNA threonylcarbamoyl adenosine modification protein YjeE
MTQTPQATQVAFALTLNDEAATMRLGTLLAPLLPQTGVVALQGPLGAGKSVLARAIIRALLDDPGAMVPSPSFTIVQTYPLSAGREVWHVDLYRLGDGETLIELGLDEAIQTDVVLVEWPERAPALADVTKFLISLALDEHSNARHVAMVAYDAVFMATLRVALEALGGDGVG